MIVQENRAGQAIKDLALNGPQYECVMVRPGPVSLWLKEGIGAELIAQWRWANLTPRSQVEA